MRKNLIQVGENLKYEIVEQTTNEARLNVEIPSETVEKEKTRLYKKYAKQLTIPGFRKGKAPVSILKMRIGPEVEEEAITNVTEEAMKELIDEIPFSPVSTPHVHFEDYTAGDSLKFMTHFEIYPVFDVENYENYDLTKYKVEVTDDLVDGTVEKFLNDHLQPVPVDRPAQDGDIVEFEALPKEEGYEIEKRFKIEAAVTNEEEPDDEYYEYLHGARIGDDFEFVVQFPDDIEEESLQGEFVNAEVTITQVSELQKPELTDEFLQNEMQFKEDIKTVDEFREFLRNDHQKQIDESTQNYLNDQLISRLLEDNPFEVPNTLIERQVDEEIKRYEQQMHQYGMDFSIPAQHMEVYRQSIRPNATAQLKAYILMEKLKEVLDITVSEEEIQQGVQELLDEHNIGPEQLSQFGEQFGQMLYETSQTRLERERMFEALLARQNIEEKTISFDEWTSIINPPQPEPEPEPEADELEESPVVDAVYSDITEKSDESEDSEEPSEPAETDDEKTERE